MADGLVVGMAEGRPFRVSYTVRCDAGWRVREVRVTLLDPGRPDDVELLSNGEGHWTTRGGRAVPELEGCIDVDISATPFTNTLPIRRLGLASGESAESDVTYVDVPELLVAPERQRYTCVEAGADGGLYRFEALSVGFVAEIPVDADGVVIHYPGLFRRAWSG